MYFLGYILYEISLKFSTSGSLGFLFSIAENLLFIAWSALNRGLPVYGRGSSLMPEDITTALYSQVHNSVAL